MRGNTENKGKRKDHGEDNERRAEDEARVHSFRQFLKASDFSPRAEIQDFSDHDILNLGSWQISIVLKNLAKQGGFHCLSESRIEDWACRGLSRRRG